MMAAADPSFLNSKYVLPPDYQILTETAEVFTKALLLGMEPERNNNFADDEPLEILPYEEALAYMNKRIPIDRDSYYALADKMRFRAFTVGRLADGDAVSHVQNMLIKSLEEGSGIQSFLELTEGQLADAAGMGRGSGWYYETVYRTNMSTAYNVGRAIGFEEVPPYALELIGIDDARQTEMCHSLTVPPFRRPYDDPVWDHLWPPFHFNCRTTVRAIYDESEIEDAGDEGKFYTHGNPDFKPAKGFGEYPLDKNDNWWNLTDAMKERSKDYGLADEFKEAKKKLIEPEYVPEYKPVPPEMVEEFQDQANQIFYSAPKTQQEILKEYTKTYYMEMNDMLYGNTPFKASIDAQIKRLDKITNKFILNNDIITYRGTEAHYYANWEVGKTYPIPAFVSTSLDKTNEIIGDRFFIEMRIKKGTKGMYIGELSRHNTEEEFLLGRNLKYKVVEKKKNSMIVEVSNG